MQLAAVRWVSVCTLWRWCVSLCLVVPRLRQFCSTRLSLAQVLGCIGTHTCVCVCVCVCVCCMCRGADSTRTLVLQVLCLCTAGGFVALGVPALSGTLAGSRCAGCVAQWLCMRPCAVCCAVL
jgi:hypothetical protein